MEEEDIKIISLEKDIDCQEQKRENKKKMYMIRTKT